MQVWFQPMQVYARDDPTKSTQVLYWLPLSPSVMKFSLLAETITWKILTHPNVAPLLDITTTPPQLILDLMPGRICWITSRSTPMQTDLDLLVPPCCFYLMLTPITSYLVSSMTLAAPLLQWPTGTSIEYVVVLNLVSPPYWCPTSQVSSWATPALCEW